MSAHLYFWEPELEVDPADRDGFDEFIDRLDALLEQKEQQPSQILVAFMNDLLCRYPEDTIWAAWPIMDEIVGAACAVSLKWSGYDNDDAYNFILETAKKHKLAYCDIQEGYWDIPNG